jgi:hypothetical protein
MESYLDAECVIDDMVRHGIIVRKDNWKNRNPETKYYSEIFEISGTRNIIIFQINIIDSRLCVSNSSLKIIAARQKFDTDNIFSQCGI